MPESGAITEMRKARAAGVSIGEGTLVFGQLDLCKPELIKIGMRCLIASHALVLCHGYMDWLPVVIGDNCYIGWGAIVLPGAVISNNCVVGAGAVVPRALQIPEWSLVIGNRAIIKPLDRERHKKFIEHMETFVPITSKPPVL